MDRQLRNLVELERLRKQFRRAALEAETVSITLEMDRAEMRAAWGGDHWAPEQIIKRKPLG